MPIEGIKDTETYTSIDLELFMLLRLDWFGKYDCVVEQVDLDLPVPLAENIFSYQLTTFFPETQVLQASAVNKVQKNLWEVNVRLPLRA